MHTDLASRDRPLVKQSGRLASLLATLGELTAREGSSFDLVAGRQAAAELAACEDSRAEPELLSALARRLGLRVKSFAAEPSATAELLSSGSPLAVYLPGEPRSALWLLQGTVGDRYLLAPVEDPAAGREWSTEELLTAARVEGTLEAPLPTWFVAEPALPCSVPAGPAEHAAPAAHAKHVHGHESSLDPFSRLWGFLRPEGGDFLVIGIFAIFTGLLALATPITVEALVNTVAFGRYLQPVLVLAGVLFCFLALGAAARALQAYMVELIQQRVMVRVVADLAERLPRVRIDSVDGQHTPELVNRFFDVVTVQKVMASLLVDGLTIVMQTIVGMTVLALYHPFLLGFDLVLLALLAVGIFWFGRGGVATAIEESRSKYGIAAWLEELAQHPSTFKNERGVEHALERADALAARYVATRQEHYQVVFAQLVFVLVLQVLAATSLLGIGGWLVISGELTLGQLVAAELIVAVIVGGFVKLGKHFESYYDLLASTEKLGHLFALPVERASAVTAPRGDSPAAVRLVNVAYHFPLATGGLPATSGEIPAGARVLLCGPPGSGKSTLLDLIYLLREPQSGFIEYDGVDLRSLEPADLREQVAHLRNAEIFSGTIAENIHLRRPSLGAREVRAALEAADLYEEVSRLPLGVETPLATFGEPLSQSQIARLMLARALIARPRLLLIDGQLDGLPAELLAPIMKRLAHPEAPWTLIVASHRVEVAEYCPQRFELAGISNSSPSAKHH